MSGHTLPILLSGATTHDSAVVSVATTPGAAVRVAVSAGPTLPDPVWVGPVAADSLGYAKLSLSGLTPGSRVWWGAEIGGVLSSRRASFRTHPAADGELTRGKILVSSCARVYPGQSPSNHPVFATMRAGHPDSLVFVHLGDQNYYDLATTDASAYVEAQRAGWAGSPNAQAFWESTAVDWVWDDHDFGANDSDRTNAGAATVAGVYRQSVPHYPLRQSGSVEHVFQIGRVRFIVTDQRFHRDPPSQTPWTQRTMLGAAQKQWLKDQLLAAHHDPGVALTVWMSAQMPATAAPGSTWNAYTAERQELWDFFAEHGIAGDGFLIVAGDEHFSALARGIDYSAGQTAPVRGVVASALDQSRSSGSPVVPWVHFRSGPGQYGALEWDDHGQWMDVRYSSHLAAGSSDRAQWAESWTIGARPGHYPLMLSGERVAAVPVTGGGRATLGTVVDMGRAPAVSTPDGDIGPGGGPVIDDSMIAALSPELWLDAAKTSTVTVTDGAVSQWDDRSGHGRHFGQPDPALRPSHGLTLLNYQPVLTFARDWLGGATPADWTFLHDGTPWTLLMVASIRYRVSSGVIHLAGTGDTTTEHGFRLLTSRAASAENDLLLRVVRGVSAAPAVDDTALSVLPAQVPRLLRVQVAPGAATPAARALLAVDGVQSGGTNTWTGAPSTAAPTRALRIGAAGTTTTQWLQGDIAEVIIVGRHLTVAETTDAERYLASKWGLAWQEPGDPL